MNDQVFFKSYIGLSIISLISILIGYEAAAELAKPFLTFLLLLGVYYIQPFITKKFLLKALSFSFCANIILLFSNGKELFFISGLIAFFVAHIMYIWLFNKELINKTRKNSAKFWVEVTIMICYLVAMLIIFLPIRENMRIPVFIYTLTNAILLLFTLKGFQIWEKPAGYYILIGAIILVMSDTAMLFDRFYSSFLLSNFYITAGFLISQYLIIFGILKLNQKKQHFLY